MAERPIVQLGNPILWRPSERVADPRDVAVRRVMEDLDDTLGAFRRATGWGRGISAVQIGAPLRIVFIRLLPDELRGRPGLDVAEQRRRATARYAMLNPEIAAGSDETFEMWDDCFSFPNLLVRVRRHRQIVVRYQDEEGWPRELEAENALSELLQHEIDHVEGILAIDRRIDDRSFCTREEYERRGGGAA